MRLENIIFDFDSTHEHGMLIGVRDRTVKDISYTMAYMGENELKELHNQIGEYLKTELKKEESE